MTGSRDGTVKLWEIGDNGITEDITNPLTIIDHGMRITHAQYHPLVNGLISNVVISIAPCNIAFNI